MRRLNARRSDFGDDPQQLRVRRDHMPGFLPLRLHEAIASKPPHENNERAPEALHVVKVRGLMVI